MKIHTVFFFKKKKTFLEHQYTNNNSIILFHVWKSKENKNKIKKKKTDMHFPKKEVEDFLKNPTKKHKSYYQLKSYHLPMDVIP